MKNNLSEALKDFNRQYPSSTSADLQTFILGYNACLDDNQSSDEAFNQQEDEDYRNNPIYKENNSDIDIG